MAEKVFNWLLSLNWTILAAGFWGGSAYSFYRRDQIKGWGAAGVIITGVVTAHYGAEWVAAHAGTFLSALLGTSVSIGIGPAGFICGLGGQVIVSGLISYMEKKKNEYVKPD